ncbi:MAG: bacteriohemerythrin [Thermosulfidibacteraceae bacterium]|jgi:hemerythrin-like metal-binding protein
MGFMEWNEKFITGVREADEQHKRLVDLINELYDAMSQGKGSEVIDKILDELAKYADYHFKTEEGLMSKYGYPELEQHKREHEAFTKKVQEFIESRKGGSLTLTMKVMNFLKEWLTNHILGTDKKYGPFLTSKMK